jgi:hypothetical protein
VPDYVLLFWLCNGSDYVLVCEHLMLTCIVISDLCYSILDIKIYLCFDVNLLNIASLSLINVVSLII